jgi:hypothetical protein
MSTQTLEDNQTDETIEDQAQELDSELDHSDESTQEPEGEVVPTFGDDVDTDKSTVDWVRNLREVNREKERENRELRARLKQLEPKVELGAKPTLAGCDYDEERFEKELESYNERKLQQTAEERKRQEQIDKENAAWQAKLNDYNTSKAKLGLSDYDDAEDVVKSILSPQQQAILIQHIKSHAMMVYALGKNPGKARELAATENLIEFAFKARDLESQMKTTTRKPAVQPEKRITGGGPTSGAITSRLDELRKEAEKTGDYTKLVAFKRKNKK